MGVLRTLGWLVGIVYATVPSFWLVVHPRARRWEQISSAPLVVVGPVWFGMWLVAACLTWPFRHMLAYDTAWSWLGAVPCFAIGAGLYLAATRHFTTDQVLGRAELQPDKHEQRLVVTGIRERVRHPIYVGHFFELLGWAIGTGMVVLFGLTAFAVITGVVMVRVEDRELEARFGDEYRAYRQRVPALIPRLWWTCKS